MKAPCNNGKKVDYRRGKRALAGHDPASAIRYLRSAVAESPASERSELSRRLYWLAIALRRLGKDGLAIKALASAQKLAPRGHARAMYKRAANAYGMPKASCLEHDEYRAFCSIQIRRYLDGVSGRQFRSQEEIESVLQIIAAAWLKLGTTLTSGMASCDEKLRVYKETGIVYPFPGQGIDVRQGSVIVANFKRGKAVKADDRCACGSGLAYRMCCGRTRLPYERERG